MITFRRAKIHTGSIDSSSRIESRNVTFFFARYQKQLLQGVTWITKLKNFSEAKELSELPKRILRESLRSRQKKKTK